MCMKSVLALHSGSGLRDVRQAAIQTAPIRGIYGCIYMHTIVWCKFGRACTPLLLSLWLPSSSSRLLSFFFVVLVVVVVIVATRCCIYCFRCLVIVDVVLVIVDIVDIVAIAVIVTIVFIYNSCCNCHCRCFYTTATCIPNLSTRLLVLISFRARSTI